METKLTAAGRAWRKYVWPIVFVVLLPCAAYLFFIILLFPPVPGVLKPQLGTFMASALEISLVVWVAPTWLRRRMAAWMAVVMLILSLGVFRAVFRVHLAWSAAIPTIGIVSGIAVLMLGAMAMVNNETGPRRFRSAGAALAVFIALLTASYVDWPEQPDTPRWPLSEMTADHRLTIDKFHYYPLSNGLLNYEELWRIDANTDVLEAIRSELRMRSSDTAPAQFWRMPPHYWPRSLPSEARLYSTLSFPADHYKGNHYFMLIDVQRGRGLVWAKLDPID